MPSTATGSTGDVNFVEDTIRYRVFDSPRPRLTYKDVRFTKEYYEKIVRPNEGMCDATDADLRASGGKLVLRHGLGDLRIDTPVRSEAEAGPALKWLGSFRSGWETTGNRGDGRWVVTRARS